MDSHFLSVCYRFHTQGMEMAIPAAVVLLWSGIFPGEAGGAYREALGWHRLAGELGDDLPTGAGVKVSLIESPAFGNHRPDTGNFDFAGKTFVMKSSPSGVSPHATVVGQRFFGNSFSMAGGIDVIDVYNANDWLAGDFLGTGGTAPPQVESSRVQNHSWAGAFSTAGADLEAVRRMDYAIERDGFTAVVGLRNETGEVPPLLAHAYNVIAVGRVAGEHSHGLTRFDGAGRTKPDLVAPGGFFVSYSVPVVSAAAALLLEEADRTPALSAARREPSLIKAILLAGASKEPFPGWSRSEERPMDERYGAGRLNVYHSHRILTAGSHGPEEPVVPEAGWRVEKPEPGEASVFRLVFERNQTALTAHLAWPRLVEPENGDFSQAVSRLARFELHLAKETNGGQPGSVIQRSIDPVNNSQHLHVPHLPPGAYQLRIIRQAEPAGFETAASLAWLAQPATPPASFQAWREQWFSGPDLDDPTVSGPAADPDGDGISNLLEYALDGNPLRPDRGILPVGGEAQEEDGVYLHLTFTRPAGRGDLIYRVEVANKPGEWEPNAAVLVGAVPETGGETALTYRDHLPLGASGARFMRVVFQLTD